MSDTREHILQVASRLFLQSNYEGVSIQDITRALGMTKGAFYHHFTSKVQLFEEVAHTMAGSSHTDFSALPTDTLHGFYTTLVAQVRIREKAAQESKRPDSNDFEINVYNLLWDAVRILPGFRASMEAFNTLEHAAWTGAVQAAIDRGELRAGLDAHNIAKIFTSVPDGVSITSLLRGGHASVSDEILGLWDTLYRSLAP